MEVHHHPDLHHKAKPWKEYILEYFMTFLAVMTGFFAESYREHLGDRSKETEYMRSMLRDLKADTAEMRRTEVNFKYISEEIDTMLNCLKSDQPDPAVISGAISRDFWKYTGFSYNNNTIQQLKSSGNFRLVLNKAVADSILQYDNFQTAFIVNQYNDLKGTMMTCKYAEAKVVYYKQLDDRYSSGGFSKTDFAPASKPVFVSTDKEPLAFYYNTLFIHEALCRTFSFNLRHTRARATRLIGFIKKEYKLNDE